MSELDDAFFRLFVGADFEGRCGSVLIIVVASCLSKGSPALGYVRSHYGQVCDK